MALVFFALEDKITKVSRGRMINKTIPVIIFLGVSVFLALNYVEQIRKTNPANELAAGSALAELYELNDKTNQQIAELAPIGDYSYQQASDSLSSLSEKFDGLRFETLGEANDENPELANSLEALQNKISAHSELLDEYDNAGTQEAKISVINSLSSESREPLLDAIENSYQLHNDSLNNQLSTAQNYLMLAFAGFLLSLAWLIFSSFRVNARLSKESEELKSRLALKGQELNIAETLFVEQKKLADDSGINQVIETAQGQTSEIGDYLNNIKNKTEQYHELNSVLVKLDTELAKNERDKKTITQLMLAIVKEYRDIDLGKGIHETQDILNKISTRVNGVDTALSKIVESFNSRAVIEEV